MKRNVVAVVVTMLCVLGISSCGNGQEQVEQETKQQVYDTETARQRAIWDANPGAELALLQCVQLADKWEAYQQHVRSETSYNLGSTRKQMLEVCMRDKGFERAWQMFEIQK